MRRRSSRAGRAPVSAGLARELGVFLAGLVMAAVAPQTLSAASEAGADRRRSGLFPQADGSLVAEAPSYRAVVGADGNLHSLIIGEVDMIDDRVAISLGGFFYVDGPRRLDKVTVLSPTTTEATDGTYTIRYRFHRSEIRATLSNGGSKPVPYYIVLSPETTVVANLHTNEAAAAPAAEPWGDVRLSATSGAYLDLLGGSRIWGPWLGRQVWEVSRVEPGRQAHILLRAGRGPVPAPTLEQLVTVRAKVAAKDAPAAQTLPLEVAVENRSDRALSAQVSVELSASRGTLLTYSHSPLDLPPKQAVQRVLPLRVDSPDFYTAEVTVSAEGRDLGRAAAASGYRVGEIEAAVERPPDFREFWGRVLQEAGSAPPEFRVALDERRSGRTAAVWAVQYRSVGGKIIHGWYVHPFGSQRTPALLHLAGYGGRPIRPPLELAARGYAVLSVNLRGNRVDQPRPRPFEDYCTEGIESQETYVYREIVGHCLRGLRFLGAQEEVDPMRLAVVGVSEGGGLGLLLAGLEPELRAVVAAAPMLCDFPLSLRAAAWPYTGIARLLQRRPAEAARMRTTLSYFDAVNFAPDIRCPVLVNIGLLDPVSLPAAVYGVFNLVGGPKEMRSLPEAGHEGGGEDLWAYNLDWLARVLAAEPAS